VGRSLISMKIVIIGLGYVGLVSAGCYTRLGHRVIGVDTSEEKVNLLKSAKMPISEPGLDDLIKEGLNTGCLSFEASLEKALPGADVALICVGTPTLPNGDVDESQILGVLPSFENARVNGPGSLLVINRSTCPVNLHERVRTYLAGISSEKFSFHYCVHPEFLREASAIEDFFSPAKSVFGLADIGQRSICEGLYAGRIDAPQFFVSIGAASLVKYADNCFHALKVTFANEIGILSKSYNVDAREIMDIFCSDTRLNISSTYLRPGMPFGGSCLAKDLSGLNMMATRIGIKLPMISTIGHSNKIQISNIVERISSVISNLGGRIGVYGLTFKKGTSDTRSSPVVAIIQTLLIQKFQVSVFDPILSVHDNLIVPDLAVEVRAVLARSHLEVFNDAKVALITQPVEETLVTHIFNGSEVIFDLTGTFPVRDEKVHGLYW